MSSYLDKYLFQLFLFPMIYRFLRFRFLQQSETAKNTSTNFNAVFDDVFYVRHGNAKYYVILYSLDSLIYTHVSHDLRPT